MPTKILPFLAVSGFVIHSFQSTAHAQFFEGAGIESATSNSIRYATLDRTIYSGECPALINHAATSYFVSDNFPPSPGLRLRLTNMSRGLSPDSPPFTVRDYNKGRASQSFDMVIGTKHRGKYFVVREGRNVMQYEILKGGSVVNTGTFDFAVQVQTRYQRRNKIPIEVTKRRSDGTKYTAIEYQCPW